MTDMEKQLIQSDLSIMMGKPVITGTRITVELILEKLAAGETIDQILDAHPRLTREAVLAALDFAAKVLKAEKLKDRSHSDSNELVREDRGFSDESLAEREIGLENLLANVTEDNSHAEVDFGPPVGEEEW